MCGLTGIVSGDGRSDLRRTAAAMCAELHHRGPDSAGAWSDDRSKVALGHQRLAILDLMDTGAQPMTSRDGRYVLAFNGEIYGFNRLRSDLEATGARFRGSSDTEVLVEAIAHHGLDGALRRVRGMFAFAVFDRRDRKIHLARDRFGEKPLYIARRSGEILFASELKAILSAPGPRWAINRRAVASFLRHGYVPEPFSILERVDKVPPGCVVTIGVDELTVGDARPYWSTATAFDRSAPPATDEELLSALTQSVAEQLVADVPVGAFLSGGIDSSLVVALAAGLRGGDIQTFTVGFDEAEYDEAPFAARVAAHLGTDHHTLRVTSADTLAVIPRLPTIFDEPFGDSSAIPTVIISEFAASSVKVSLSGDGGDELFGGYDRYGWADTIHGATRRIPRGVRGPAGRLGSRLPSLALTPIRSAAARLQPALAGADEAQLRRILDIATWSDPTALYRRLVSHWTTPAGVVRACEHELPTALSAHVETARTYQEHLMLLDTVTYLPGDILVKVDRAGMASSLETRIPFLSPEVAAVAWRGTGSWRNDEQGGKAPLRRLLADLVPVALTTRPKMGFGVPICEWLRGPLRPWADDLLTVDRLRWDGLLEVDSVRATWEEHLTATRDRSYLLWDVLMLNSWLDSWSHRVSTG